MAERDETAVAIESQPVNSEDDEPLVNSKLVTHTLHGSRPNPSVSLELREYPHAWLESTFAVACSSHCHVVYLSSWL